MEPEPKRRQLVPVVFEKNNASSSEMCESTESGICRNSLHWHMHLYFTDGIEEACYACIISEVENAELEKALKVSAIVILQDFKSSYLNISLWDFWYVILLMGIICQKTSQMSAIWFLFVRNLKEKCSVIWNRKDSGQPVVYIKLLIQQHLIGYWDHHVYWPVLYNTR